MHHEQTSERKPCFHSSIGEFRHGSSIVCHHDELVLARKRQNLVVRQLVQSQIARPDELNQWLDALDPTDNAIVQILISKESWPRHFVLAPAAFNARNLCTNGLGFLSANSVNFFQISS